MLAVTALGTLLVSVVAFAIPPRYTAVAEILVSSPGSAVPGGVKPAAAAPDEWAVDTQIAMLTSEAQLCQVLENLAAQPAYAAAARGAGGGGASGMGWVRAKLGAGLQTVRALLPAGPTPDRDECGREGKASGPRLSEIKAGLRVFQQRRSLVVAVSYTGQNPAQAAIVVNEVVQRHVAQQAEKRREQATRAVTWLDSQLAAALAERDSADAALRQHRLSNGTDPAAAESLRPLLDAKRQLALIQFENTKREALLTRIRSMPQHSAGLDAAAAALGIRSGDTRPAQLAEDVREGTQRLESELRFSQLQATAIGEQVAALQQGVADLAGQQKSLAALEQRGAALARLTDELQRRREEGIQERDLFNAEASVFTLARTPQRPSSFGPLLVIPPGIAAFMLLGAVVATAWDRLDRSFRNERDVTETLGIPCIGLIPELPDGRAADSSHGALPDMRPSYHQAIRSVLVTALGLARSERESRIILVTASVPREGASTLALSLGFCAVPLGQRVLLIDLSQRNRDPADLDDFLNGGDRPILMAGDNAATETIREMANLGYDYLSGAEIGVDLLGFLISKQGQQLFPKLRRRYDCILIDGPPVLGSAEARILASLADEVLLAVRWGETRREVSANAVELLRRAGTAEGLNRPRLKAVLTRADLSAHARYQYGDAAELLLTYDRGVKSAARKPTVERLLDRPAARPGASRRQNSGLFSAFRCLGGAKRKASGRGMEQTSSLRTDAVEPG